MSVWDVSSRPHVSWCTFTAANVNLVALALAVAAGVLTWRKTLPIMRLVFLCALAALVLRA